MKKRHCCRENTTGTMPLCDGEKVTVFYFAAANATKML